jgi:hypothetical protein
VLPSIDWAQRGRDGRSMGERCRLRPWRGHGEDIVPPSDVSDNEI